MAGIPASMHPSMISWLPCGFDVTKTTSALHDLYISFTSLIVSGRPPMTADSKSKYNIRKWAIRTLVLTIPNCYALTDHMTADEPRNCGPKCFRLLRTYPYQIPTKNSSWLYVNICKKLPTSPGSESVIKSDDRWGKKQPGRT